MTVEHATHPGICPNCGEVIPLFMSPDGKNTVRATICKNPDCHSKVWMDDEEIHNEFRVPFGTSDEQPKDED